MSLTRGGRRHRHRHRHRKLTKSQARSYRRRLRKSGCRGKRAAVCHSLAHCKFVKRKQTRRHTYCRLRHNTRRRR